MKRFLPVGETISVDAGYRQIDFHIKEVLGVGGSCVAYRVQYYENGNIPHNGILKEYCPAFLEKDFSRTGTSLNVPVEMKGKFSDGLDEFKRIYKVINEYLSNNLSASNFHTVQIGMYESNNTAYTLTSCDYGMSYDKVGNESLLSICKTMLSVAKAVELYHDAGFLHLDIKPKNILVLNDVSDLIKLFDFDSLTSIEGLRKKEIIGVPVPEDYYVPELEKYELRKIGIETDIFEIGAMMFLKVFGRAPETAEMEAYSKYPVDTCNLFAGVSPRVRREFIEFFGNTIQISIQRRYKSVKELKDKLEIIISLISESEPYLINLPKWQPSKLCIGRQAEIKEIKKRLDENGYVFVKGIGGIGKSEVAKMFAEYYKDKYHTVQFCRFSDSLKSVVAVMPMAGVDEKSIKNAEELINEKNKILHMSDSKTLIIVDNFNVTYDDYLRDFLPSDNQSFKVIFTTRCSMAADYYEEKTYDLPALSPEDCKSLFYSHSQFKTRDEDAVAEELIKFVDFNTLIIVLMAIAVRKAGISLKEMLSKLEEQEIDSIEEKFYHEYDFSSEEVKAYNKIYAHLLTTFSVYNLTDIQMEILKNATLISPNGIELADFVDNCGNDLINQDSVSSLAELGWLDMDQNSVISMHPVVSDLMSANSELPKEKSYYCFSEYLEDLCNPDLCHYSIVLNKLACARHLDRRYKFEPEIKALVMSIKLGRLYESVYQPGLAKDYLNKALKIAYRLPPDTELSYQGKTVLFRGSYKNSFVVNILSLLGNIEKEFGKKAKAIEYYRKCIYESKKTENRFYDIVIGSLISIGECYNENHNNPLAYNSYLEALIYAVRVRYYDCVSGIADSLVSICQDSGWHEREDKYRKISEKFKKYTEEIEEMPGISDFKAAIDALDFNRALEIYSSILSYQKENLGEDSPDYKDLKRSIWALYAINKQKEEALHSLSENLDFISETSGADSIEMARELSSAAQVLVEIGEYDTSEQFSKRALAICEQKGYLDEYVYIEASFALANVYLIKGKLNEAEALVDKIDFSVFSGKDFLSDVVSCIGFIMCQLSRYDEIEPLCLELLSENDIRPVSKLIAEIILATIYEQKGILDKSEYYIECAGKMTDKVKTDNIRSEWLTIYYRARAKILFHKGNATEAIKTVSDHLDSLDQDRINNLYLYGLYMDRGIYYINLGKSREAAEDFEECEKILHDNSLPEDAFASLFNNIAVMLIKDGKYQEAEKYLEKIISLDPSVLSPESFFETLVCVNTGWVRYNLGDVSGAYDLIKRAIPVLEKLEATNTFVYRYAINNLGLICIDSDKPEEAYKAYMSIRKSYDPEDDKSGKSAFDICCGITAALLEMGKTAQAYDFACEEIGKLEEWLGKISPIRIETIIRIGIAFRAHGLNSCFEFFFMAYDLMEESGDVRSPNYARLLNFIGIYLTDIKKEYGQAKIFFERSKRLFEEINAVDDDYYQTVIKNIEYVDELNIDDLISDLAKSLNNSTKEED